MARKKGSSKKGSGASRKKNDSKKKKELEKKDEKEKELKQEKEMEKSAVEMEPIKEEDAIEEEDEYAIEILGWATSGYDTSRLEELMKGRSKKKFEKEFKKVKKNIEKLRNIKKGLEELNISGVEKEVDELLKILNDPYKVKEVEKGFEKIKKMVRARDMEAELDSMMAVEELKDRIEALKARLKNIDELDSVEEEMKDLRREFKESYILSEFVEMIEEKPRTVKKIKVIEEEQKSRHPMEIKDLFVFSGEGKFLGHKTARKGKIDKKQLIEKLNIARDFVKNERFSPGVLIKVPKDGETLLVQKGNFVALGMIVTGETHRLTGKLMKKGIEMIEKDNEDALKNWNGKASSLLRMKKDMNAIIYAAIKLGKEMQEK